MGTDGRTESSLEHAYRRLEHLYRITKLFAQFENVEQTFDTVLGVAAQTLPLRSAILVEVEDGKSKMILWPSGSQDSAEMKAAREHVEAAVTYLLGPTSPDAPGRTEQAGRTALPPRAKAPPKPGGDKRFIVIPLNVARHAAFGALQLEAAAVLEKPDLVFVNAIANQLAIAVDRARAWRRDITGRELAEGGRAVAEARGLAAEQKRVSAEASSERSEALARENRALYEHAQQAVRVREQVLAIVSHDLKNPLGTIIITAAALARRAPSPDRRKGTAEAIIRIRRAAERIERLIEDLLDFASIEAGRLSIQRRPQDPGSMIQEALASFEAVAQEKGLRLSAEVEPHLPEVYCDRDRILQVLSNLVANATKVTPEGGRIALRAERRVDEVMFAVSDTGPGIGEHELSHLFERYWRSGEVQYKGTGLGLAIARGIVSAHDGHIWVETEPARGATFFFTIPVEGAHRSSEAPLGTW